jgi:hypothetical protein
VGGAFLSLEGCYASGRLTSDKFDAWLEEGLYLHNSFILCKLIDFKGCSVEKKGGTNGALFVPGGQ